jgi:putative heme transporter
MADPESGAATPSPSTDASGAAAGAQPPSAFRLLPAEGAPPTLVALAGVTWRVLVVLAGVVVFFQALGYVGAVVLALFFAALMTALAGPIAHRLERFLPKILSVVLALLVIAAGTVVILYVVVRSVINEGPKLVASVTGGIQDIETWLQQGPLQMSDADLNNLIQQAEQWGTSLGKSVLGDVASTLGSLGTLIVAGSVFLFGVLFFMTAPEKIWGWVIGWVPSRGRDTVDVSGRIAWDSISGYTRGIVIVALADATLVFIGLLILQVPLAPALAAVVFLGAFIPVIGAPIATLFAAIVALAERGPLVALLTVGLTVVVGSFDGDVLQPLVMGKAVSLHPLAIVILIAAGSIGFGIIGALVAVPLGSAVYGVLKYLTGRDPDHPRPGAYRAPDPEPPPAESEAAASA